MRPAVSLKTLYRSPGKTIISFLLLAVLTFSLFLQLAEYRSTAREFAENVEMYSGTGYVEKAPATYAGYKKLQYPYYLATDTRIDTADLPDFSCWGYPSLSNEEVTKLAALPYISSVSTRYMTAGHSAYHRLRDDDNLWDYNARAILEGTLTGNCYAVYGTTSSEAQAMRLADSVLLAGDLDMDTFTNVSTRWQGLLASHEEFQKSFIEAYPDFTPSPIPEGKMENKEIYFLPSPASTKEDYPFMEDGWIPAAEPEDWNSQYTGYGSIWDVGNIVLKNYSYGLDVQNEWTIGDRYVFVFRFNRVPDPLNIDVQGFSLSLYDWISEHFSPAVWNITDAPENYLDLPEYAPLKKLIEITISDLNTLDVVYADDMSAIKLVKDGKMALIDGRWLTKEDTDNGARVCMLDEKFARTYRLKVGDTLPLELGDVLFEQFFNLGAIASVEERYADNWTTMEFEIVGLYKTAGGAFAAAKEPNWNYSVNTVFVPLSSLPETVDLTDHEYAPGEFTFRVDNAWDIAPFLAETAPKIEEMGLTLMFDDGGWMEVYKPYAEAQRIAMIRIALLAVVTVMATAFVVYLFISRKRKDYAIMRALGTPKRRSAASLLLPLMVLTAGSVVVGLTAAAVYGSRADALGAPSVALAALCGGAELLLALLLALLMLHGLGRKSPLALLQGETRRINWGAQRAPAISVGRDAPGALYTSTSIGAAVPSRPRADGPGHLLLPLGGNSPCEDIGPYENGGSRADEDIGPYEKTVYHPRPIRFTLRYIFRHIRRSAVKSLLSILVAALMLAAVAQLEHMRIVYDRLETDTVVTAKFTNSIILPKLKALETDGFTENLYYERSLDGVIVLQYASTPEVHIALTNDVAKYVGIPCEIDYANGHGPKDMGITGKYVLLGTALIDEFGISPGEMVRICKLIEMDSFIQTESRRLQIEFPGEYSDERRSLWEAWPEYMEQELDTLCDCLTVIGVVSTGNSTYDNMVFTPGMETTKKFMNDNLLEYAEFRIPDNSRAREMKQRGEEMTGHRKGAFSIDIEKLESVERTAHLLETLYPIVVALTLIIGAFLCALIILQTAKDAAIMRVQGTSAAMTRAILAVEQVLLAVLGVGIGLAVMAAIKGRDFPLIAAQTLSFGGAYIAVAAVASTVSAVLATKKNLLELLQTKE